MTLVAILTVRRQAEALFRDHETAAAAIMARHGGSIERVVSVLAAADEPTFREIHLLTFPDAAAFKAYGNDPALGALAEQRTQAIVATELFIGEDHPPYQAPSEPRLQAFTGGCHCGRVRFRVTGDLSTTTECNCSICTQKGFLHLIVPSPAFELLAGRDDLTTYTFNTGVARHTFCRHCGMHPFYVPRSDPDKIDVNVRCLDGVDIQALRAKLFDGRNWEVAIRAAVPWRLAQSGYVAGQEEPMARTNTKIFTALWYAHEAEEAARFYASIFPDSRVDAVWTLPTESPSGPAGSVKVVTFTVLGQQFQAMSAGPHDEFNDAISLVVNCDDQAELDRYWNALIEGGGKPQACGWLNDRFGVRWQIVPTALETLMRDLDPARAKKVADAMMKMVKLDIAALQKAARS